MKKLVEMARKNGRTVTETGRKNSDDEPIYVTYDDFSGTDAHYGTVAELTAWESGYCPL